MSSARNSSAGPIPERRSTAGEPYAPDVRTTSSAQCTSPVDMRMPTARRRSRTTPSTSVSGRIVRFARPRAAARYVNAAFMRTPPATFCGRGPIRGDCSVLPFRSATNGKPRESAAATNARSRGLSSSSPTRNTGTGPAPPWSAPPEDPTPLDGSTAIGPRMPIACSRPPPNCRNRAPIPEATCTH